MASASQGENLRQTFPSSPRRNQPCPHLDLDVWLPECERMNVCCLSCTVCVLCYAALAMEHAGLGAFQVPGISGLLRVKQLQGTWTELSEWCELQGEMTLTLFRRVRLKTQMQGQLCPEFWCFPDFEGLECKIHSEVCAVCVQACLLASVMSDSDPMDWSLPGSSVHGILQQEYWSGLPYPSPGDLPDPGTELPRLLHLPH